MVLKGLTPEIQERLEPLTPLEIPADLFDKARKLNINRIYCLRDLDFADCGVYGNHIVVVNDGQYIDFDVCPINSVKTIISLLFPKI